MGPIPVLTTKLFPPTRRQHLVPRHRLVERLRPSLEAGHRLTLVSAPAGFGKTTALGVWLGAIEQRPGTGVGWLSLDEDDNDRTRFLAHLVAALRSAGLDVGTAVLDSPAGDPAAIALTPLVNDLARAGQQEPDTDWVVVLDDYHVVEAPAIHDLVAFLLDHLPDRVHLVLATRSDPPLPLSRLRVRGQLTELRAADLRFTPPEVQEYFDQVMGLELSAAEVDVLQDRTEGWVAGLQLAALSLRDLADRDGVAGFLTAFAGSNRFVLDYLADEVLARQPPATRGFLLRTAVLDRLHGPLCDALTGAEDGAQMLADLERKNLFVVPLDPERSWYRYHHLFADVLHARLLAERPQEVRGLHQRASAWFAGRGLVREAVRHAIAAEDFDRAAYLMEEALPELRRTRSDGLMLSWTRSLPDPVVRRSPVLSIWRSWSLLMSGDLDAAAARLDDAEAALAAGAADPALAATWAQTEDLRTAEANIWVYRASLAQARGDVADTVHHARRAWELAGPDDHFVRGAAGGFLGLAAWATGDVDEALATFSAAIRSLHAAGNLVDELDSTVVLADMWVASGRPGRARRRYEEALQTATAGGPPYPRATADLHVGLAELDRERGDLAGAEAHLESAGVLAERASITENQHRFYVAMAQVRADRGDHDTAMHLLSEAESRYRRGFYPDLRPIAALRTRMQIARGDLGAAGGWAEERALGLEDDASYLHEYEQLTLVRLLLARHRADPGRKDTVPPPALAGVLDLLERRHAAAARVERHGSLREIRMLQALALQARGDLSGALAALGRSLLGSPEPDSYARLYLDEGAPMLDLLRVAAGGGLDSSADAMQAQARRLLGPATAVAGGRPGPPDPLSRREHEVLRLLDTELTGPEIARRLYVSLNTLRTHTKRIFTKLDVSNRTAAVRRAHERGLL